MIFDLIRLVRNHLAMGKPPTRAGQRVTLNPRAPNIESHPTVPYKGSIHECEGTVERFFDDDGGIRWDNGESGRYNNLRLTVCDFPFKPNPSRFRHNFDDTNPNLTFKRWKMEMFGEKKGRKITHGYVSADAKPPMSQGKYYGMLLEKTRRS
jgi:hypothetical protein